MDLEGLTVGLGLGLGLALGDNSLVFVEKMVVVWVLLGVGWVGVGLGVLGGGVGLEVGKVFYVLVVGPRGLGAGLGDGVGYWWTVFDGGSGFGYCWAW